MSSFKFDLGVHANDAAALAFLQARQWDTNSDGTGLPRAGMYYRDTTLDVEKIYTSAGWTTQLSGSPPYMDFTPGADPGHQEGRVYYDSIRGVNVQIVHVQGASEIPLLGLGTPTDSDVQDFIRTVGSAGLSTGGSITDAGGRGSLSVRGVEATRPPSSSTLG